MEHGIAQFASAGRRRVGFCSGSSRPVGRLSGPGNSAGGDKPLRHAVNDRVDVAGYPRCPAAGVRGSPASPARHRVRARRSAGSRRLSAVSNRVWAWTVGRCRRTVEAVGLADGGGPRQRRDATPPVLAVERRSRGDADDVEGSARADRSTRELETTQELQRTVFDQRRRVGVVRRHGEVDTQALIAGGKRTAAGHEPSRRPRRRRRTRPRQRTGRRVDRGSASRHDTPAAAPDTVQAREPPNRGSPDRRPDRVAVHKARRRVLAHGSERAFWSGRVANAGAECRRRSRSRRASTGISPTARMRSPSLIE